MTARAISTYLNQSKIAQLSSTFNATLISWYFPYLKIKAHSAECKLSKKTKPLCHFLCKDKLPSLSIVLSKRSGFHHQLRGERYPNWFNSIFEFCQKMIQFNIQFNSISRKFNSRDYPIQYFSQKFNSKNYSIQKISKKFNSKNYSIQ